MFRESKSARTDQTLSSFLDWAATRYASRPALLYQPAHKVEHWTYQDLRQDADRVSCWMKQLGVEKGDRIVIWAPNSPWWVITFFGILRLGAVVVPLDTHSSSDFVDRVLSETEPKFAVISAAITDTWGEETPAYRLEDLPGLLPPGGTVTLPTLVPDDLAEIVFTSGTTAAPKGVMLTHGNLRSNFEACYQVLPTGRRFHPLAVLPLSHLFEQTVGLLLPLRGGAGVAFPSSTQPQSIVTDMQAYGVTTMLVVPRLLSVFMEAIEQEVTQQGKGRSWQRLLRISEHVPRRGRRILFRRVIRRFGELDFFVVGGAALEPEIEHKWEQLGIAILQGYGSTETSPVIAATSVHDRKSRSVGKPVPGVEVRFAPDGEMLVKGPNVTPGYWRKPEATAAAFEHGWYKTGDLGEIDAEGRLYLRGRKKDVIVLANGLKVYPGDVEAVLRRMPKVIDSVVVSMPSSWGPQVHAVLLCESDSVDHAGVIRDANAQLAHHQRIRGYSVWQQPDFPRTRIGKVKRQEVLQAVHDGRGVQPAGEPAVTLTS